MNKHSGKRQYSKGATAEKAEPPKRNFFNFITQNFIFHEDSAVLKEV